MPESRQWSHSNPQSISGTHSYFAFSFVPFAHPQVNTCPALALTTTLSACEQLYAHFVGSFAVTHDPPQSGKQGDTTDTQALAV